MPLDIKRRDTFDSLADDQVVLASVIAIVDGEIVETDSVALVIPDRTGPLPPELTPVGEQPVVWLSITYTSGIHVVGVEPGATLEYSQAEPAWVYSTDEIHAPVYRLSEPVTPCGVRVVDAAGNFSEWVYTAIEFESITLEEAAPWPPPHPNSWTASDARGSVPRRRHSGASPLLHFPLLPKLQTPSLLGWAFGLSRR